MKRLILAVVVIALLGAAATASADSRSHVVRPHKHLTIRKHFKPWAHPSTHQVVKILHWEQKKWGGPSLVGRSYCESGWDWNANKGMPYHGILALGSVAWKILWVWPHVPRKVKPPAQHRIRWAPIYRVRVWDSGRRIRKHIRSRKQKLRVIRVGKLPRHPSAWHAWASARAVQLYVAHPGRYQNVSWSCPL